MPPPNPGEAPVVPLPCVIVKSLIDTVSPGLMAKTRTALFPLTVNKLAPGPVIVSVSPVAGLMVRTVPAKTIVCGVLNTIGSNVIVSEPAAVFESKIACRKLPAPLSFVLVTGKFAPLAFNVEQRQEQNTEDSLSL